MKAIDLHDTRFGRLTVIQRGKPLKFKNATHSTWECLCDCGQSVVIETQKLRSGHTKSCGCYRSEIAGKLSITHGHSCGKLRTGKTTPEYASWASAKSRCHNPTDAAYPNYGGRGIQMCKEWREDFMAFYTYMGPRPPGMSIDRIDVNGNYGPGNCRWATNKEQVFNRRKTIRVKLPDETEVSLRAFALSHGVPYLRVYKRVRRGIPPEEAIY